MEITLDKATCAEIRGHAMKFVGGFGMWLELGKRFQRTPESFDKTGAPYINTAIEPYYNCYTPGDDEFGDLDDHTPWSDVKGLKVPAIDGLVQLDFYVHDKDELIDNLIVELDARGVKRVWVCTPRPNHLRYTRED